MWGSNLSSIQQNGKGNNSPMRTKADQPITSKTARASLSIFLDAHQTKLELSKIHFWRLFQALFGNTIDENLKGLTFSLSPNSQNARRSLEIEATLHTS